MQRHRLLDSGDLALQYLAFGTGTRTDPFLGGATVEAKIDRRRNGGVTDAHLADAQQIRAAGDRLHAESHCGRAIPLRKCRFLGDVAGRIFERQVEDLEAEVVADADLVDRSTTGGEILDHLGGNGRRERGDALTGDAVIAGEDRHQRPVDRRRLAGPGGEPEGDLFETSERARRLRQLCVPLARRDQRCRIRPRQVTQQFAEIIKRQTAGTHAGNPCIS
ncbi:hypothetical protein D9M68_312450 [compost metagenome]